MSNKPKNKICIIGMPGSGKTTVGKLLSKELNYIFFDTDKKIELDYKTKIKEIFKNEGEEYFREIESKVLQELIVLNNFVISTGGGIIIHNEQILKKTFNIYLNCKIDVLIERTSRNKSRPLVLENTNLQIKNLFNERKDLYNKISDLTIDVSENIQETIKKILMNLIK